MKSCDALLLATDNKLAYSRDNFQYLTFMHYSPYVTAVLKGLIVGAIATLLFIILFSPFGEERTETIFVYGTLTNPIIRTYACWCLVGSTPATLADYRQAGLTVLPEPGAQVDGRLVTVSPTELARIDRYENIPDTYRRVQLDTTSTQAWIYIRN
jgi:gamma-glutamylcyclotransferase (GGCT)/AIG2-like uncharacterized protein YtfP